MKDEIFKIKYDNVTVNGVKAKTFSLDVKNNEVTVKWEEEDFNLHKVMETEGIVAVKSRLDRCGIDYDGCFYDSFSSIIYLRTPNISRKNKFEIIDCLGVEYADITTLSDRKHTTFESWSGEGWLAIRIDEL